MTTVSLTDFRRNLSKIFDQVFEQGDEIVIRRRDGSEAKLALVEKGEMDETEYLLSNPENARRLMESIAQLERGEVVYPEEFNR